MIAFSFSLFPTLKVKFLDGSGGLCIGGNSNDIHAKTTARASSMGALPPFSLPYHYSGLIALSYSVTRKNMKERGSSLIIRYLNISFMHRHFLV